MNEPIGHKSVCARDGGLRACVLAALAALLAACSDVQSLPLGEVSRPMTEPAHTRSHAGAAERAATPPGVLDAGIEPAAPPPTNEPPQPPPAAADAGAPTTASDGQVDSGSDENDDDDDDDSEESAERESDSEADAGPSDED